MFEDTLSCAIHQDADLPWWAALLTALIEDALTVDADLSVSTLDSSTGIAGTQTIHTCLPIGAFNAMTWIRDTGTIYAGFKQWTADLRTGGYTLTVTTELTRLTVR